MRRGELAHERQKTNLAEPLVSKSWLRCTDKNFADFAKNGVFQHNRRIADIRCGLHGGLLSGQSTNSLRPRRCQLLAHRGCRRQRKFKLARKTI
jgi:hypothetical protein